MTQTPSAASRQLVCAGVLVMPIVYMVVAVGLRLAGVVQQEGFGEFDPQLTLILTGAFVAAGITTGAVLPLMTSPSVVFSTSHGGRDEASKTH